LKTIDQFSFTSQDYSDFIKYLTDRNFSYRTETEESLSELIANAKKEKYFDQHKEIFSEMQKDLNHSLSEDLMTYKNEITGLLEDEILTRYFYEEGSIAWSIKTDEQVLKAVEILNKSQDYNSILQGKKGSVLITHEDKNSPTGISLLRNYDNEVNI